MRVLYMGHVTPACVPHFSQAQPGVVPGGRGRVVCTDLRGLSSVCFWLHLRNEAAEKG